MKKVVRKFASHAESEKADREYYRSLSPQQRLDILLEIIAAHREETGEASEGFKRVYRVTQLGED